MLLSTCFFACVHGSAPLDDVSELRDRAEEGRSSAQTALAYRYMTGRGVQADERQAIRWYMAAARQCDPAAADALVDLGRPVPMCELEAPICCAPAECMMTESAPRSDFEPAPSP